MDRVFGTLVALLAASAAAAPLSLPELIARARENDHRVKESAAQLRYLKAKYQEARWAWFPRFDTYVAVAGPTPEARNDGLGGAPTTKASLMYDLDFGQVGLTVRAGAEAFLPIWTFGKLDALEEAGAKGVVIGEALQQRAKDEAELQMCQAFFGYSLAVQGKVVLSDTVKRLNDAKVVLERLLAQDSEQVTAMDVYKLEYYVKQLEAQVAATESGRSLALAAVQLVAGAQKGDFVEVEADPLREPKGTLAPVEVYVARAKDARPEIRAVEAGIGAREREVFIRERFYYPDFGIAGFIRFAYTTNATRQLSPFAYDPYNDFSGGVALAMRYSFDFPQKAILLEQSRAELQKLTHQRDLLVGAVQLEVEKSWNETQAALVRSAAQTTAEKSARKWAQSAFNAFDLGTGDTRELVDAFTALAVSAGSKLQAYHDAYVGLRQLTKSVGQVVQLELPVNTKPAPPAKILPVEAPK